jgi:hypothetical protein
VLSTILDLCFVVFCSTVVVLPDPTNAFLPEIIDDASGRCESGGYDGRESSVGSVVARARSNLIYLLHRLQVGIYYSDTGHISTCKSVLYFFVYIANTFGTILS